MIIVLNIVMAHFNWSN